ncbi:MAG: hypothetical protein H7263_18430 [Candidatus Sericytochromatia bacterium]|nr:hypothetical protein [Candidatus Sericytochromatia bacterium]
MANNFRNIIPKRTCVKKYAAYGSYKKYISADFNRRCGYTDCSDFWFGGSNTFHIDHFKPWKKNPHLKTEYSNLVYCCSYVNILKSDDEGDYLDPCDADFNQHFERDSVGNIIAKTHSKEANYMYNQLKLYMKRYQIIWMLDEILIKLKKIEIAIKDPKNITLKIDLHFVHSELSMEMTDYIEYLRLNQ